MFQIVSSSELSCPGVHWQWARFTVSGGTLVSVGFQNSGNAQNFWSSQMFPESSSQAYIQVNNSSLTSTGWWAKLVISTPGELDASAVKVVVDITDTAPLPTS